jgi:DNA-binding IclR family transcriptional regulator
LLARLAPDIDLVGFAEGPMRELRDRCGHSAVLSCMTPRGALVMLAIAGTSTIEIGVRPGSELPFHASAQGKVLLAFAPLPTQERILAATRTRLTPHTRTDAATIKQELARIAQRGYGTAPEETLLGINAVAAPVFDDADACVASVAVVGSIQFLSANPSAALLRDLKACAHDISRKLGHGAKANGGFDPRVRRPRPLQAARSRAQ